MNRRARSEAKEPDGSSTPFGPNEGVAASPETPETTSSPSIPGILRLLPKARIVELGRTYEIAISANKTKDEQIEHLLGAANVDFAELLGHLKRDELRTACRESGLESTDRARQPLIDRLLAVARPNLRAHRDHGPESDRVATPGEAPRVGDIVRVRSRQYLVESVTHPPDPGHATWVRMVCLDDDDPGRRLEVLWEIELAANVIRPEEGKLQAFAALDNPRDFAAYLHALQWNAVTATDAELFQAPFRAGIKVEPFQLTPLMKALELPRANLFIADDVGLGKTIEAGLVLQELLLRQRVDHVLVVAPAAVCLQWQDELRKRFGLGFEVYDRRFVARRRRERGFAVNPWATHNRFIISYSLLRRPEYLEPLIAHLGQRQRKSLLILDEAHTIAPASSGRYAVDSGITKVVRDQIAVRFENRLFLSATPHNGHSNSFSALLEVLDPNRFTRGVPIGTKQLQPIMIRRLKRDIRAIGESSFPTRNIVELALSREGDEWQVSTSVGGSKAHGVGSGPAVELELATLLREYTTWLAPRTKRAKLALIGLQKRLLSSVAAFARTLLKHADTFERSWANELRDEGCASEPVSDIDDDLDVSDEAIASAEDHVVADGSREFETPRGKARALLQEMIALAQRGRFTPDARVLALFDWLRTHLCPAIGRVKDAKIDRRWTSRRVIIFTESIDTKRWLGQLLGAALHGTDRAEERILELHGAMPDDRREEVQRAFNDPGHAVRILLATDAAREGVNLQGQCADLFHFDIPWNPARLEQRNGRIDRTLQPADVVRCHYFRYVDREEDIVLQAIVRKVEVIAAELGSLGEIVHQRLATNLEEHGIVSSTLDAVTAAFEPFEGGERAKVIERELEAIRKKAEASITREVHEANRRLVRSAKQLAYKPALLRDTLDVGLALMNHGPLERVEGVDGAEAYRLPELPASWDETLDTLRPPRERDEPFWEWRKKPPQSVVFEAPPTMTTPRVHLHLQHPFVRRVIDRFLAQGTGAHDLQRVTVIRDAEAEHVFVLAFGRLSLFGHGAVRLHDQLVPVVARWDVDEGPLPGSNTKADQRAVDRLERLLADRSALRGVSKPVTRGLIKSASSDFAKLWPHVRDEAQSRGDEAVAKLQARGRDEATALKRILEEQQAAIRKTLEQHDPAQQALLFTAAERTQLQADRAFWESRLEELDRDLRSEPAELERLFEVSLRRLEPVGLVYLWPEAIA